MPYRRLAVPFAATLIGLAGASACVEPAAPDDPMAVLAPPFQCPFFICGNAGGEGPARSGESLDQSRLSFSPQGQFRIVKLVKNGVDMQPQVDGFFLTALDGNGVTHPAAGGVMHVESAGGQLFRISIAQGTPMPYFEGGQAPNAPLLPTYRMTYVEIVDGKPSPVRDLCGLNKSTVPRDALVFEGDRYDYFAGKVSAVGAAARPWFNIACKDDALWKLALMRHVEAGQSGMMFLTSRGDRTAGLRAIRADYCGTGAAMTVNGTAVDWSNLGGWLTIEAAANPRLEAYWNENGAICVDVPRYVDLEDIGCVRPTCDQVPATAKQAASFRTQVP